MTSIFVFLLLFIAIGLSTGEQFNCSWPEEPEHGYFRYVNWNDYFDEDLQKPKAITKKVKSYNLRIICVNGYTGIGHDRLVCLEDGTIQYTDFECLPECVKHDNLLSCHNKRCLVKPEPVGFVRFNRNFSNKDEECGLERYPSPDDNPLIVGAGGRTGFLHEVPWHAGVYTKRTRPYMQICGGTLVKPNIVISAAHCFWSEEIKQLPASDFAVAVGKRYRPWHDPHDALEQKSNVADIKIPPYFQGHATNLQEDIALVFVETPFKYGEGVHPACLDFNERMEQTHLAPSKIGKVPGWGLTSEDGLPSQVLQIVDLPVIDVQECFQQSDPKFRAHITSDKFCAGRNNGTAVCKGDSGGGFFVGDLDDKDGRFYLRGVVSGAPQNEHLCNVYSWASFTRVYKHERFIKEAMEEGATIIP